MTDRTNHRSLLVVWQGRDVAGQVAGTNVCMGRYWACVGGERDIDRWTGVDRQGCQQFKTGSNPGTGVGFIEFFFRFWDLLLFRN